MATREDKLLSFLFAGNGRTLENIKFFRGDRDLISAEELEAQVHSALMQKKAGRADVNPDFPDVHVVTVDVREFVAQL